MTARALRLRKISHLPDTVLPRVPQDDGESEREVKALPQSEVGRLLHALQGDDLFAPVAIAAGTGLRRGEVLALHWQDIEPDAVNVTGNVNAQQVHSTPKTRASRRRVPIAGEIVALIASHRAAMAATALKLGRSLDDGDLLFPSRPDAPAAPQDPRLFSQRFARVAKQKAGLVVHFHQLRHSHATALLERGERVEVVSERLGHASPGITLAIYANVLEGAKTKAAATAGAVLDEALAWQPPVALRLRTASGK